MNLASRSALLATFCLAIPAVGALAQPYNNPGNTGGVQGSIIATPHYPAGQNSDPALTTGRAPRSAANLRRDENPTVPGATGHAIVPGNNSTVTSDRQGTTEDKTGATSSGGGGG
jgi:hypothetical protein